MIRILITITTLLLLGACGTGQVRQAEVDKTEPVQKVVRQPQPTIEQRTDESSKQSHVKRPRWADRLPSSQEQPKDIKPQDYDDVWTRIRAGLNLPRPLNQPSLRSKLKWYSSHQAYLDRVATRATPYIYHIVQELEARDMPLELALLPIVESAYQPLAYSRSHASGIWQFIPATGERFGLKQNWWYDGRNDITAATQAALDYLQFLITEFNGNWPHAIAAYNVGENNVHRAIAANRAAGKPTDFWSLALPAETRGYVPALLAVAEIVARPDHYGITLQPIPNKPYFRQVATHGQIEIAKAARLANISEAEMKRLNPGFKRWATDPDGPHGLLIPMAKADRFSTAVAQLPEAERVSWQQHSVRRGETLSQIARRYGTSVSALQRTNNIRGHLIRTGQNLMIPAGGKASLVAASSSGTTADRSTPATSHHTVRKGDTLWTISRRYGYSVADLTSVNQLQSHSVLQPGQQLQLPGTMTGKAGNTSPQRVRYTVRRGDSLWAISRRFDVPVTALQEWNRLGPDSPLRPGQELELYVDSSQPHGI